MQIQELTSCDETSQQIQNVVKGAQSRRVDDLVDDGSGVLSKVTVDKEAKEEVDDADEGLCANHALPEIHWVSHLRHERDEEDGTTVRIYTRLVYKYPIHYPGEQLGTTYKPCCQLR